MKKSTISLLTLFFLITTFSCHFHLDFMGKEEMQEVVLLESRAKEKILVIDVEGMIASQSRTGIFEREGDILSRVYYRLEKASRDKLIRGVILRLDTPGGDVTSSDILYQEIRKFRQKTGLPVVALMMGVAASGGYYAASACDHIIAHSSTITGSIGVIAIFPSFDGLFSKLGVKVHVIKSGELKDAGSLFRDMSEEEQKVFQGIIDEFYSQFLDVVQERKENAFSLEELRKIADGRVYTGPQALELNLIDEVGYFDSALKKVLTLASLSEAKIIAYTYYPSRQTNLYASTLNNGSILEMKALEDWLPSFKSGFYYLWLPEMDSR